MEDEGFRVWGKKEGLWWRLLVILVVVEKWRRFRRTRVGVGAAFETRGGITHVISNMKTRPVYGAKTPKKHHE